MFCKVALIPEATPLSCGFTEFITAVMFGAANIPIPDPIINSIRANGTYAKLYGRVASNRNATALITKPTVDISLAPILSDKAPLTGPNTTNPSIIGMV